MNKQIYFKRWTEEEDQLLLKYRPNFKAKSKWKEISKKLFNGQRNASQCAQRYHRLMHPTQQSIWTETEDDIIKEYVEKYGQSKWKNCVQLINANHSGKQIRERWKEVLKPGIKRGQWSWQEDQEILNIYQQIGKKWKYMSQQEILKGRTENQIKNRFNSFIKKYLIETDNSPVSGLGLEEKNFQDENKNNEINNNCPQYWISNEQQYTNNFEYSINTNFNLQLLPFPDNQSFDLHHDHSEFELLYDQKLSNQLSLMSHKQNDEFDFAHCLDSLSTI